jgi:hypothetical protein
MPCAVAQITERTCERVERTAGGLEIWMWTEPVEWPARHLLPRRPEVAELDRTVTPMPVARESPAGDHVSRPQASLAPVEVNPSGRLPAYVPTAPESVRPRPQPAEPLGRVGQTDDDASSNPLRFQEPSRWPAEPTAPTAPALTRHSGDDRAHDIEVSTSPSAFTPLWSGAGHARRSPLGPAVTRLRSPRPSREEGIHDSEAGSPSRPAAPRAAVGFDDRSEEPARHASSTPGFAPFEFLASLTFCAVLLPVAVFLILYRLGRRYGLTVRVEFTNPRHVGHDAREQASGVSVRDANDLPSNRLQGLSAHAPFGSTWAQGRHREGSSHRDEGQTLVKQILDDNTGLRHQIARMATGAA